MQQNIRIDSHQHFWNYDAQREAWITDDMQVLKRNFLPEELTNILELHGFTGSVAVQASQSEDESIFLLALAGKFSFIKGVVGWVDLQADNIHGRLEHFSQFPLMKGFRHILQGEPNRKLMLESRFLRGVSALQSHFFTFDLLILPDQLSYARELVARFPKQKFVIDHIAKPEIRNGKITDWARDMRAIAAFENVYCKVSGMATEANRISWKASDLRPYLDVVFDAFGIERLMYGSDWPVCLTAGGYAEILEVTADYFSALPEADRAKVFGLNAIQFYSLEV